MTIPNKRKMVFVLFFLIVWGENPNTAIAMGFKQKIFI